MPHFRKGIVPLLIYSGFRICNADVLSISFYNAFMNSLVNLISPFI